MRCELVNYDAEAGLQLADLTCVACQEPVEGEHLAVFLTAYARGEERADFYGVAHQSCREPTCAAFGLYDQEALIAAA